jgi:hypothetical protein
MPTRRLIRPNALPVGGGLQDQADADGDDDRRRNRVHAPGVVVAQPTEMGAADNEENKDQRKERDPQGNVGLLVHETATLSLALGRVGR